MKMKKVYVFLAEGFEEVEAVTPIDILRRAGADVVTVSVTNNRQVTGARGVPFVADALLKDSDTADGDLIVLPGGFPGYQNLADSAQVISIIKYMLENGRLVAAICGAPAAVLGKNGFLKGKSAVCYPGMEADLNCNAVSTDNVCADGNIITSKSAATALEFSLELVTRLFGDAKCSEIKKSIVYNG